MLISPRSPAPPRKSALLRPLHKTGGRNNTGRITTRHKGGGHKRQYRLIDFRRHDKDGVPATVAHIEYDPNRTARIALLHYADGEKRYILAPTGLKQGDQIEAGVGADIKPGNSLQLRNIPPGYRCARCGALPGWRRKIARSAGTSVQLVAKEGRFAQLRMPSGEIRNVEITCRATIGEVGNAEQSNINWGKAGRMRWKGKRPHVRGVVMTRSITRTAVVRPHVRWSSPRVALGQARGPYASSEEGVRSSDRPPSQDRQEPLSRSRLKCRVV